MKNFKFLLVGFFVFFSAVFSVAHADNPNPFVFTTDPQSVAPNTISSVITVQSQNSSGAGSPVGNASGDTADVVFTSTSPTGQFLNSTGGAVTKTMSYNSYTKNFYYEDSTVGIYTLTVTATTRTSQKVFTASQQIYIGQPVPGGGNSGNTASTTGATATTTSQSGQSGNSDNGYSAGSTSSANSSPASISDTDAPTVFEVSAGRDRLTSVGNSLLFTVTPVETKGILPNLIGYTWSFGDGTTGTGNSVHHTYKFAGQYSVVVNATASDQMAVDRLTVKVVDPKIVLQKIDGGTQVTNNSGDEINLENWILSAGNKSFNFPQDTLIPAGRSVTFADDTTGINAGDLQLKNPLGKVYASAIGANLVATVAGVLQTSVTATSAKNLDDISASVSVVSQKLSALQSELNSATGGAESVAVAPVPAQAPQKTSPVLTTVATVSPENPTLAQSSQTNTEDVVTNPADQTATVFVASSSPGIISRIFALPVLGFNFIRSLFIEK